MSLFFFSVDQNACSKHLLGCLTFYVVVLPTICFSDKTVLNKNLVISTIQKVNKILDIEHVKFTERHRSHFALLENWKTYFLSSFSN